MSKAKKGDKVSVHYTGRFEDGTVFDSSENREPLEFVLGSQSVISGFENGVTGMEIKEKKTISILPADGYGEINDDLFISFEKNRLPENMNPKVGDMLEMNDQSGNTFNVVVTEVSEKHIVLDANHPMAGKTLIFDLELVGIEA